MYKTLWPYYSLVTFIRKTFILQLIENNITIFLSSVSFHDVWQCSWRPCLLFLNVSSTKSWSLSVMPEKRNGLADVFTSEWNHSQGIWKSGGRFFLPTFVLVSEQALIVERVDNFTWWMNANQWLKYLSCAGWSYKGGIYYSLGRDTPPPWVGRIQLRVLAGTVKFPPKYAAGKFKGISQL